MERMTGMSRYWTGNVNPSLDLTGKSYSDLASLGFLARIDNNGTTSSSYRDVSISNPSSVNALLFGAKLNGSTYGEDRFKITKMSGGTVPVPGTLFMFAFGVAALFHWHRSSNHRM